MFDPIANLASSSSSFSDDGDVGNFVSRWLFFLQYFQVMELILAVLVFVVIHSLRQKRHGGLPVWPLLGMLPLLVMGLRSDLYEWISDVLCKQNGTFEFKGPCEQINLHRSPRCSLEINVRQCLHDRLRSRPRVSPTQIARNTICQSVRRRHRGDLATFPYSDMHMESHEIPRFRVRKEAEKIDKGCRRVRRRSYQDKEEGTVVTNGGKRQRLDLLTVFMRLKDEQDKPFSDKFLRDICVNFILAGRDTSSVALSWFFWLLEKNPMIEETILAEICGIVNERDDLKNGGELKSPLM
ncbi:hypothetical protein F3Y22_tig00111027pilonHSYRG00288 [Hibiscus syriacus]|uniref:Cytochrome P450 n=1 Tax=Hibiscus syriacus TaxID=106335 RepID=A0A6A2Z6W3_HIBSY|nr:hypothetical protein F3Y22_tig00111027pilonHSYRG00288 [Hibiscus syriacus]